MKFLSEHGYRALQLAEAARYIESGQKPSDPSVVLTFDDGFQDFSAHAFPVLERYRFTATVFLPTGYIVNERGRFNKRDCLTWHEVRELDASGVTFGSHTVTHPQLALLGADDVEHEVRRSKETIEDQLGHPVDSFSYPFAFPEADGRFRAQLQAVLAARGYRQGVTTVVGTAGARNNAFFLPRLPISDCDDLRLFQAKLEGGYDWLHPVQYAFKLAKFEFS